MASASAALIARFRTATLASSGVEFAVIFPVLLVLMLIGIQVVTYVNAVHSVERLVNSMSETISQAVPPSKATTIATVTAQDIHFFYDSGLVVFPYLLKDAGTQGISWWQDINIDFASIQFNKISGTDCSGKTDQSTCYTANVVWTSSGTVGPNARACGSKQTPVSNQASPSSSTLPRSIFGPASMVVVDVVFTFTPTFASQLMGPIRIARTVYIQPRYASLITFDTTGNDGIAMKCAGY